MKKLSKNQKIGIMAAAVLFVAVVAVVAMFAGRTQGKFRSIKIVETSGKVTISRAGIGDLDAGVNMNLVSGDSVHTDQDAYVVLMLDTDKYVMLGESGTMEVIAEGDETSGRTSIRLEQGSVLSEIQNPLGQNSSYEVVTPNATMSVRGTVFEIDRGTDGLVSLLVYDGAVAIEMDGAEPVLCNAGEYMQFEEGNPPKVIVDRASISEEMINEQMRQRLEKINESGRGLNLGSVKIAENEILSESPDQEPEDTPEPMVVPEPTATPESAPKAEAGKTPEPTAASKPERTPAPAVSVTPSPELVPEPVAVPEQPQPTAAPAPAPEQPQPTVAPAPTPEQPRPTAAPAPTPEQPQPTTAPAPTPEQPRPTTAPAPTPEQPRPTEAPAPTPEQPQPTAAPVSTPEPTPAPVQEYTVTFANPYVWVNGTLEKIGDIYEKDGICAYKSVEAGKTMQVPEEWEVIPATNDSGVSLKISGWYLEHGEEWNFDTYVVNSDFTLYPVWEEVSADVSEGGVSGENTGDTVAKKYWPVIFKGVIQTEDRSTADICVCLPEGTSSMPKENLNGEAIEGWKKSYGGAVGNGELWNALVDSVKGMTILKVWEGAPASPADSVDTEQPAPQPVP